MRIIQFIILLLVGFQNQIGFAQIYLADSALMLTADFRFRAEQDWNSRKSNGTYRDDRFRLRYRGRVGFVYSSDERFEVGMRIRTGQPGKQQDPQLTVGTGYGEAGLLPIGLEKIYGTVHFSHVDLILGKQDYPFIKNNELFWSDNVYPEGVGLKFKKSFKSDKFNAVGVNLGHYIFITRGTSPDFDSYFQGVQLWANALHEQIKMNFAFYYLKNIGDIPDGLNTIELDYKIAHAGFRYKPMRELPLVLKMDGYHNFAENYAADTLYPDLEGQDNGFAIGIEYGKLKKKRNVFVGITYTWLERYAALDYMAQNDWARWDYSAQGSADGRLTNLQGVEMVLGYALSNKVTLKCKYYWVEQLVAYGPALENGQRIRFDIDIRL